jgi:hypothetical protein
MKFVTYWIAAIASTMPVAASAADAPVEGLLMFRNDSSATVSISVDGSSLCSMAPASNCSTVLTGDPGAYHSVAATSNGRSWSDRIRISECHWNYQGTKTYTFRDSGVPFTCVQ